MKKIMVVEDDKALCNGICLALKSEELFFYALRDDTGSKKDCGSKCM